MNLSPFTFSPASDMAVLRELWPLFVESAVLGDRIQEASDSLMRRFQTREALEDEREELDRACIRAGKTASGVYSLNPV